MMRSYKARIEKAQEIVAQMAASSNPAARSRRLTKLRAARLANFYATAAMYGLANGIGLNQWEAPFLNEDDARQVGATSVGATMLNENMTLALRVTFETEGKDDSFRRQLRGDGGAARSRCLMGRKKDSSSLRSVGMTTAWRQDVVCHFDPFGKLRVNSGRNLSSIVINAAKHTTIDSERLHENRC